MTRHLGTATPVGLWATVLLLIVGTALAYYNAVQQAAADRLVDHTHRVLHDLDGLLARVVDAETGQRGFLITGNSSYLKPYHAALEQLAALQTALRDRIRADAGQQARLDTVDKHIAVKIEELRETVEQHRHALEAQARLRVAVGGWLGPILERIRRARDFELIRAAVRSDRGRSEMEVIRAGLQEMRDHEEGLLAQRAEEARARFLYSIISMLLTGAAGVGLIFTVIYVAGRSAALRERALEVIAEERERLRVTLASIGDAVIVTDSQGRINFMNPVAARLTAWNEDALGQPLTEVFHIVNEHTGTDVESPVAKVLRAGTIVGLANHTVLIGRDGASRPIDDSGAPIRDTSGAIVGVVLVFRDVTQRREADHRKDEFLAMLAHELRNPLAPVRNALHIVQAHAATDPVLVASAAMIARQVEHMVRLVDDLIDVSRFTSGKIELRKERADLVALVNRALEMSRPFLDSRRHTLHLTLPAAPVAVEGDPIRLTQVMTNLLNNAAKFTAEGGRIWLTVEPAGSEVRVRVRDNGPGISERILPRIFDLFVQGERALDRTQGGLGIGLTLVKRLVELHGGSVEAHSEGLGQGSEFLVTLPLATPAPVVAPVSAPAPATAAGPGRRVLVVDDNRDAADSLQMLLTLLGHEVRVAYDGRQALETLADYRPDVVFLDIGLPGMTGYEVVQRIRQEPALRDLFVVALTGYGSEEERRRAAEAGYDRHLVKPPDLATLQALLARLRQEG